MTTPSTLSLFSLAGKRVAVLGGEGLLGKVCCQTIAELDGEAVSIDVKGGSHVCNIGQDYPRLFEISHSGDYWGVINCVVGNQRPVHHPASGWNSDLHSGLTAAANAHQAFYDPLRKTRGVFLNIGSDLGLKAPNPPRYSPLYKPLSYCVVKHGIIGLTRYYAALWGRDNIRCNALCPGSIDQGQAVPDCALNRLAQPYEMKGAIAWLMSDASSYVTGAIICVDGGSTI